MRLPPRRSVSSSRCAATKPALWVAVGLAVVTPIAACGGAQGDWRPPELGGGAVGTLHELSAIHFETDLGAEVDVAQVTIRYPGTRVYDLTREEWRDQRLVFDDVSPALAAWTWQLLDIEHSFTDFSCSGIPGVVVRNRQAGTAGWYVYRDSLVYGAVLDRGRDDDACEVLQEVAAREGVLATGYVVRPRMWQGVDGQWMRMAAYQAGIAYEFYQELCDTIRLRIGFELLRVDYERDCVKVYSADKQVGCAGVVIAKPRDGYWPWAKDSPEFFRTFSVDTLAIDEVLEIEYASARTSITFSLDITPVCQEGIKPIIQRIWVQSPRAPYMRGRVPVCREYLGAVGEQ